MGEFECYQRLLGVAGELLFFSSIFTPLGVEEFIFVEIAHGVGDLEFKPIIISKTEMDEIDMCYAMFEFTSFFGHIDEDGVRLMKHVLKFTQRAEKIRIMPVVEN